MSRNLQGGTNSKLVLAFSKCSRDTAVHFGGDLYKIRFDHKFGGCSYLGGHFGNQEGKTIAQPGHKLPRLLILTTQTH